MSEIKTAGQIASKAAEIVEGSRQQTHGDKERSFAAAALLWTAYLAARKAGAAAPIQPKDVAALVMLLKVIRSEHGNAGEPDHYVDMCGYGALFGELAMGATEVTSELPHGVAAALDISPEAGVKPGHYGASSTSGILCIGEIPLRVACNSLGMPSKWTTKLLGHLYHGMSVKDFVDLEAENKALSDTASDNFGNRGAL